MREKATTLTSGWMDKEGDTDILDAHARLKEECWWCVGGALREPVRYSKTKTGGKSPFNTLNRPCYPHPLNQLCDVSCSTHAQEKLPRTVEKAHIGKLGGLRFCQLSLKQTSAALSSNHLKHQRRSKLALQLPLFQVSRISDRTLSLGRS